MYFNFCRKYCTMFLFLEVIDTICVIRRLSNKGVFYLSSVGNN